MSTRSSIWLGETKGKSVHIYWELGEGEKKGVPVYIALSAENADEVAIRLPKKLAVQILSVLDDKFMENDPRVV
jgi:hypothetical protein